MSLLARVRLYEYEAGNAREVHCLLKKKKKKNGRLEQEVCPLSEGFT